MLYHSNSTGRLIYLTSHPCLSYVYNNNHNHTGNSEVTYIPNVLIYEQTISIKKLFYGKNVILLIRDLSLPDAKAFLDNKKKNTDLKYVYLT